MINKNFYFLWLLKLIQRKTEKQREIPSGTTGKEIGFPCVNSMLF